MLNIDQELLSNLSIKKVEVLNSDIFEIKNIIDKYQMKNVSDLPVHTAEIDNEILTEYIIELYVKNEDIPADLSYLIQNNIEYRLFLLTFIKKSMRSIVDDEATIVYKEIFKIINLLSMGENHEIFSHYNYYSTSNITKLFRTYENRLRASHQENDSDEFEITFQSYITLLEVFNELCIINSLDVQRRKTVPVITECMVETISNTKLKIIVPKDKIKILNTILGKLLLYFSFVPYVNVENKGVTYIIEEYIFMLKKITDGYTLLSSNKSDFDQDDQYYVTFLDKITTLILTLMLKLKSKTMSDDLDNNESLINLIHLYNKYSLNKYNVENLSYNEFKIHLLDNYLYIYNNSGTKTIEGSYKKIIDEFVHHNILSSSTLMLIHNIVLFDDTLTQNEFEYLLKTLLSMPQLHNDYYEFFKLKIIDRIIHLYKDLGFGVDGNVYIKEIVKYIEQNKVASHLIGMYSKIYLSLALYYSSSVEIKYLKLSKEYYSLFLSIDNYTLLNSEYKNIDNEILKNYGEYLFRDIKNISVSDNKDLVLMGKRDVGSFLINREFEIKTEINQKITTLIIKILNNKVNDYKQINILLDDIFSKKLFYGLVIVNIEKKGHIAYELDDMGYDHLFIKLNDEYKLSFYYSKAYAKIFNLLYISNSEYIKNNMSNIIDTYIQSIPTYTDETTKLPNLNKLKSDLKAHEGEITFIELYLDSLVTISMTYPYKTSNYYFYLVTQELNKIKNVYKLTGPRLGIIVNNDENYKDIVKSLKDMEVLFEEEKHIVSMTVAVSFGEANSIMDKSHYCLSAAKLKMDNYHEFR